MGIIQKLFDRSFRFSRWLKFKGYKKTIASMVKDDIKELLIDPSAEGFITKIPQKGLSGFALKPFTSIGFEVTDDSVNFTVPLKFHYLFWTMKQIYGCRGIVEELFFYDKFTLKFNKEFSLWVGGKNFQRILYTMYKIHDNINKGMIMKPQDLTWEQWDREMNYIRMYLNFYVQGNYALCIDFVVYGRDSYFTHKNNLIRGYENLCKYWRIFE